MIDRTRIYNTRKKNCRRKEILNRKFRFSYKDVPPHKAQYVLPNIYYGCGCWLCEQRSGVTIYRWWWDRRTKNKGKRHYDALQEYFENFC